MLRKNVTFLVLKGINYARYWLRIQQEYDKIIFLNC